MFGAVAAVERAAAQHRNPERLEVIPVQVAVFDQRVLVRAPRIAAFARHLAVAAEAVHRQVAGQPDVLHAADLREALVEGAIQAR